MGIKNSKEILIRLNKQQSEAHSISFGFKVSCQSILKRTMVQSIIVPKFLVSNLFLT